MWNSYYGSEGQRLTIVEEIVQQENVRNGKPLNLLGQSITIKHLAPYLRVSYERALKEYSEEIDDIGLAKKLAIKRRNKALKDGIQTIRYQLSTLSSVNG